MKEHSIRRGRPIDCGAVQIIPIERWTRRELRTDRGGLIWWSLEPLGVEVVAAGQRYALDLEGRASPRPAEV